MKFLKIVLCLSLISLFTLNTFTGYAQASEDQKKSLFEELKNRKVEPFVNIDPSSVSSFIKVAVFDEDMNFRGTRGVTPELIETIGEENYNTMITQLAGGLVQEMKLDQKINSEPAK